jgi:hypothetical protein
MYSNAGPWNDFEVVHPWGIKRKDAVGNEETKANHF